MPLSSELFIPRLLVSEGSENDALKLMFSLLKIWAKECMSAHGCARFERDGRDLNAIAENVRCAGACLERWSVSANGKARRVWESIPEHNRPWNGRAFGCAHGLWTELALRSVTGAGSAQINSAFSFLDSDPEIKRVVEAHKSLEVRSAALFQEAGP
jgi:hypothetical protein